MAFKVCDCSLEEWVFATKEEAIGKVKELYAGAMSTDIDSDYYNEFYIYEDGVVIFRKVVSIGENDYWEKG